MMHRNLRRTLIPAVLAVTALLFGAVAAQASDRWLHVTVDGDDEQVDVNIPLGLVRAMLPMIEAEGIRHGRIDLGHELGHEAIDGLGGMDLAELVAALRDTPDTTFVKVRDGNDNVRVAKEDGYLLVDVDEDRGRGDNVRVRLPIAIVEALVVDTRGEIDLVAALDALERYDGEPLVTVDSDDEQIRIWIDSNSSSD